MELTKVSLDDKYTARSGRVYLTGIQALVRLPISQHMRDVAAGLNTAGYISGYRGSPLSGYDSELIKAKKILEPQNIFFDPGLNEELGATAVWGSQQTGLFGKKKFDGVHSIWYAKNPGLDRAGDALKHGNFNGSSPLGGVLAVVGDDHAAKSATMPNPGDFAFMSFGMPILYPSNVQEVIDFGLFGWAMSRFSGCWIGFKVLPQLMDASASVSIDPERVNIVLPEFEFPPGGVHIRWPDDRFSPEARLLDFKLPAAKAFAGANAINRIAFGEGKRFGIVTAGKSYLDVLQALDELGIDERRANQLGISVLKLGLTWPIDPVGAREFCLDREEILVVEEKQPIIQDQLRTLMYHQPESRRPRVVGQTDQEGRPVLSPKMDLDPMEVAQVLARRLLAIQPDAELEARLQTVEATLAQPKWTKTKLQRVPYFCSGCPHSSSIPRPMDSREGAGIGCHWMAMYHEEFDLEPSTQMGGEGANWVGQAHFTDDKHVFQNLGDGTFYHSGSLAIRFAVASNVNITYKILYNDASAMTGGQPVEGHPTVPMITNQMHAEGVRRIAVVSDDPGKYPSDIGFAPGTTIHHRDEMEALQLELREHKGVSVLIYDQTCAAEKRRRRKRGTMPDPQQRLFINDLVCEGCGDCSDQSNCISVEPIETEFGRKRHINQSSCNKDYSCKSGFCPSFVTVEGGKLKKHKTQEDVAALVANLPEPPAVSLDRPYNLVVTGIGGTGVITVGALLGMAAHIEGKGSSVLDSIGLAQKNGSVLSYVRVGATPEALTTARIPLGATDCLIACDMVVAAGPESMVALAKGRTRGVVNGNVTPTAAFVLNPDVDTDTSELSTRLNRTLGKDALDFIDAQELSARLLGDAIGQNVMLLGAAYQKGLLPVGLEALERAIEMNGVSTRMNREAFAWGRLAAHDLAMVERIAGLRADRKAPAAETVDEMVVRRAAFLTEYQNAAYADRYRALVVDVRKAEAASVPGATALSKAVARYYFKLMAYKDEYEVARLHTDPAFMEKLKAEFEGDFKLAFNLAPPIMAKPDPVSGEPTKKRFGPWVVSLFKVLRALKGLRGTAFDIFGYSEERKLERRLIVEYADRMHGLLGRLSAANYDVAVEIASLPEGIRGYGHIKRR
ncbi:MAG TPA: indolepyruvate ferredoxin oxidoreductase family protein, partial [Alphaproteobacteria bacterium]|nr:indolepyruvate ferredoxin oxidoreductase family protein [Alphaproteobacteria bacterium]